MELFSEIFFESLINCKDPDPEPDPNFCNLDPKFRITGPDPGGQLIADPPDQNPQHWLNENIFLSKSSNSVSISKRIKRKNFSN